jgi:hypothetical protein
MKLTTKLVAGLGATALSVGLATAAWASTPNTPNTPNTPGPGTSAAAPTTPARVFAVINADGTTVRGNAVTSSSRISTGTYDVRWNRNITTCAWTGTLGLGGFVGGVGPGMIGVTGRAGTNNGVFVETFDRAGTSTDEPFTVLVVCS